MFDSTNQYQTSDPVTLVTPYGDKLVDLITSPEESDGLRQRADFLPAVRLSLRTVCDLELLATGAFSPLDSFMSSAEYSRVLDEMRLTNGMVFPVPVTLPIADPELARPGTELALCDTKNEPLAVMVVDEVYEWDRSELASNLLGTTSDLHPLVAEMAGWGNFFVSGRPRVFRLPAYYDFPELRLTPREVRARLSALGHSNVVAFQTRNPLHRAHEEMTKRAMTDMNAALLMHPVVGLTKSGDIDSYSRVRSYQTLIDKYYPSDRVILSLLPLAMRFAGPREAVWHAIIRRNFGASHFIVGRNHADPGSGETGVPLYPADAARRLADELSDEIGVEIVPFEEFVYLPESGSYAERSRVPVGRKYFSLSGTEARERFLSKGRPLPEWFARPEVAEILEASLRPRHEQGVCIWLTGLCSSGKSTTAEVLTAMLSRLGRRITLLDGDVVRTTLSADLGFDREARITNIRRIGFVASEIVRHGGISVCAAISPYREARTEVRRMIGDPNFVEVFVSTPLEICEQRDAKGLYARARRGEITNFTGIDDVYEPPIEPELTLDTVQFSAEENAATIIRLLTKRGFLPDPEQDAECDAVGTV